MSPVRRAVGSDLAGLLELYRHLSPSDPPASPERSQAVWAGILGTQGLTVFVAEADGRLVAS